MDRLWTPWRYQYITRDPQDPRKGVPESLNAFPDDLGCVFCNLIASVRWAMCQGMETVEAERAGNVLLQTESCFVCLNAFPYSSGHVLIVPYEHQASLAALDLATASEIIHLAQQIETALRKTYSPDGINMGLNLGEAAGAGVAAHLHLHALPRWTGDGNFMTVIGETRVIPETLDVTWRRLRQAFGLPENGSARADD